MCGITGIARRSGLAEENIIAGLSRLEYRGYDSAGIATIASGTLHRQRSEGKLSQLLKKLEQAPLEGRVGIGHTRWATHGAPNEVNAHPHGNERIAVVHNGIIENHASLRAELMQHGFRFSSETDTETIPLLIEHYISTGLAPREAVQAALGRLHGAFALAMVLTDTPECVYFARRGSPLAVGMGKEACAVASDALAISDCVDHVAYLQEGDWGVLTPDSLTVYDAEGNKAERAFQPVSLGNLFTGKEGHQHFMHKEIHEQPTVAGECLAAWADAAENRIVFPENVEALISGRVTRLLMIACGTSCFASLLARYWFETIAQLAVDVEIASEFRYRDAPLQEDTLAIVVSQSGETADTLACLRLLKEKKVPVLALVNAEQSSMAREADGVLPLRAGPEIGVASTKAFTAQLMSFACLALAFAQKRGSVSDEKRRTLMRALAEIPSLMAECLSLEPAAERISATLKQATGALFIGRGTSYPLALEGALKLKEISYIHAEGYAAGELKHGPIALVDEHMPVIALAPHDRWLEKTLSNIEEVRARGGQIIVITDAAGAANILRSSPAITEILTLPSGDPNSPFNPMICALPVQLLAYHTALLKGTDVDQPRNLAKSVTVE